MKQLNELVELAKEISSKQWFLNADEEVTAVDNDAGPDDSGEAFIGCAANIQLAKYISTASPENILAIAEEFRALEQGKTDAETVAENWKQETKIRNSQLDLAIEQRNQYQERAEAAEEKLAEMEKQQAVGVARMEMAIGKEGLRHYQCFVDMRPDLVVAELNTGMELFTRPAPAFSLAELVPDCLVDALCNLDLPNVSMGDKAIIGRAIEVLRNIEENK